MTKIDPAVVVQWCAHTCLIPALQASLRRTEGTGAAERLIHLEAAALDALRGVDSAAPTETFTELAVIMVGAEASRRPITADIARFTRVVIEARYASFAHLYRGATIEEAAEVVGAIMTEVAGEADLSPAEARCIELARTFSELYWVDELARDEAVISSVVLEAVVHGVRGCAWAIVAGLAVLKGFAEWNAVPKPFDCRELVQALRLPAVGADEYAVALFVERLARRRSFNTLAPYVQATRHARLLQTFARLAPADVAAGLVLPLLLN